MPQLEDVDCIREEAVSHKEAVTAVPQVTMTTPLRSAQSQAPHPLYDDHTCNGGLADTWTSVKRVFGHFATGLMVTTLMDKFFDAHPLV